MLLTEEFTHHEHYEGEGWGSLSWGLQDGFTARDQKIPI